MIAPDFDVFFNPAEFGDAAEYRLGAGQAIPLAGLFIENVQRHRLTRGTAPRGSGVDAMFHGPAFLVPATDAINIVQNGTLIVRGQTWFVSHPPQVDRRGVATLYLGVSKSPANASSPWR